MAVHTCNTNTWEIGWRQPWLQCKFRAILGWMRDDLIKSKGKTIQLGVDVELWHQCCSLAAVRLNHNVRQTHMEVY